MSFTTGPVGTMPWTAGPWLSPLSARCRCRYEILHVEARRDIHISIVVVGVSPASRQSPAVADLGRLDGLVDQDLCLCGT